MALNALKCNHLASLGFKGLNLPGLTQERTIRDGKEEKAGTEKEGKGKGEEGKKEELGKRRY